MEKATTLSNTIDVSEYSAKYDTACKQLLSEKIILAWIMKNTMKEYYDVALQEIVSKYIIGSPEVGMVPVEPDMTNTSRISGTGIEDTCITEGTVVFDIRFQALLPDCDEAVGLIINIEAQNDFYPGYPLIKRGIYYCGRMISSQYGTVFTNSDYGKIKKVYSVWICTNPPAGKRNTITCYSINEKNLVGNIHENIKNYDLMSVIMIYLDSKEHKEKKIDKKTDDSLLDLLNVLLSNQEDAATKKRILEEDFDIPMTEQIDRRLNNMCNLSKGILDKGMAQGMEQGKIIAIIKISRKYSATDEQCIENIMNELNVTREKAEEYYQKYSENIDEK